MACCGKCDHNTDQVHLATDHGAHRIAHPAVLIQAARALAAVGDSGAVPLVTRIVVETDADAMLRLEAMTTLSALATTDSLDLLLDLLSDSSPAMRGAAILALARVDPDTLLAALSGLDPDPDWTVRAAEVAALAPSHQSEPGLVSECCYRTRTLAWCPRWLPRSSRRIVRVPKNHLPADTTQT